VDLQAFQSVACAWGMIHLVPIISTQCLRVIVPLTMVLAPFSIARAATSELTITPGTLKFARVTVTHTRILQATIKNTGSTAVTITTRNNAPGFRVRNLKLPLTLHAGKSVTFNVTFTPTIVGLVKGSITFQNASSTILVTLDLRGVGVLPWALHANPPSLTFEPVAVGRSRTLPVALTNAGKSSITVSQDSIGPRAFSFTGLSLPVVIAPGQSFTFKIKFSAQTMGAAGGTMQVSNPTSPILRIPLAGTGVAGLNISPATTDFGNVPEKARLRESGALSATGASITVSSANITNPLFVFGGLKFPVTIRVGQNVPFNVTFSPRTTGAESGTLSFTSNAGNSPREALKGVGISAYSVHLSWNASTSQVVGYDVYRRTSTTKYQKINLALVPGTNYTDRTVSPGTTYYYETKAVDSSGQHSLPSNRATAIIP